MQVVSLDKETMAVFLWEKSKVFFLLVFFTQIYSTMLDFAVMIVLHTIWSYYS